MNRLICEGFGLQGLVVEKYKFSEEHQKLVIWARLPFDQSRCQRCGQSFYASTNGKRNTFAYPLRYI